MPRSAREIRRLQRRRRRAEEPPPTARTRRGHADTASSAPSLDAPAHITAAAQRQGAVRELQASRGNAHMQRLLAREVGEAAAPTVTPEIWEGDHGTFHIFPDDLPLSLADVQDPERERPIPRQVADAIRPASELLKGGPTRVELKGDVAFKAALLMDLAWVMEQSGGRELLDAVMEAGRALTLEYAPDGGEPEASSPTDAELRPDGTLGPGSDVLLRYGPEPWSPADGLAGWEQRKPATGLARALVALLPLLGGAAPSTRERDPVTSSAETTGQDKLAGLIEIENRARSAFGLPTRPAE